MRKSGEAVPAKTDRGSELGAISPSSQPLYGGELLGSYQSTKALGRYIAFPPKLARKIGIEETVFLLNLLYAASDEEEWVKRSVEEIEEETSLTYKQQCRVRNRLASLGLVEEKTNRRIHLMCYRVVEKAYDELLEVVKREFAQLTKGQVSNFPNGSSRTLPNGSSLKEQEEVQEEEQEAPSLPKQEGVDPEFKRKMEQLNQAQMDRRIQKQNRAAGNFRKPIVRQNTPARVTHKQPESWIWFATEFKRRADTNPVSMEDLWPMVDEMIAEIGMEEAESRLSIWLDNCDKPTKWSARDFLAGGWRTVESEEGMPRIVNEE
jgi:hypothetical protein